MKNIKLSIVTVVKNGMPYLIDCIKSFESQDYKNKELIFVISKSNDGTYEYLKNFPKYKCIIDKYSKNKFGSMNLGLKYATGDYIGYLHSDDIFFNPTTLTQIAKKLKKKQFDVLYGNIVITHKNNFNKPVRIWKDPKPATLYSGWMPPHVTLFVSKDLKFLKYNTEYSISGDYEYILKLFSIKNLRICYFDNYLINMRAGGDSQRKILKKFYQDYLIQKFYFKNLWIFVFILKILRKIKQYFFNKNLFYKNLNFSYNNKFDQNKITLLPKLYNINKKKYFILSAINLAFFNFFEKGIYSKYHIFWPDGIMAKSIKNLKQVIPGYILLYLIIRKLKKLKNKPPIYFIGNVTKNLKKYIFNQFDRKYVKLINLKFVPILELKKQISKKYILKNSIIFIILPTPKQEELANYIFYKTNMKTKIFCFGGAHMMLSGDEPKSPRFINKLHLRFIWRLSNNTRRRVTRLIISIFGFLKYKIFNNSIIITKN